ncbi:hypothetical protein ACIHFE_21755 [Streptomyces sp. NPDC052396]|uniref:hypothetical protein n=1 Tax=Streptomyces sp. NPDC052396 TaxID=3365689 RepID=UPI0037D4191C
MNPLSRFRVRAAAIGGALLLAASATGSAVAFDSSGDGARPPKAPSLTGSAKLYRSKGDDIRFSFDAHGFYDQAKGSFRFSHRFPNGVHGFAEGRIDCLLTGGRTAVATGVIVKSDVQGAKGVRVGFTVQDLGGRERLGHSWTSAQDLVATKNLPKCVSSAPYEVVEKGHITVVPWQPKL